jgi:outer membrane protein assembly factor BamA
MKELMYKNFLCIGLFFLFAIIWCDHLGAQDADTTKIVQNIVISGNDVTDENVILRELLVKVGDIPDSDKLEESKQRLMNLYLFNRVEMNLYPQDEDGVILFIEVTEQLYFYPVPILTIRERDWSKWSYGLRVVNTNFRGQNERIWAGFWLGYRPGFGINYIDTWAGDSLHLTLAFNLMKTVFDHRTIEGMEENHVFGRIAIGKWWGFHFNTNLSFHYDRINQLSTRWVLSCPLGMIHGIFIHIQVQVGRIRCNCIDLEYLKITTTITI